MLIKTFVFQSIEKPFELKRNEKVSVYSATQLEDTIEKTIKDFSEENDLIETQRRTSVSTMSCNNGNHCVLTVISVTAYFEDYEDYNDIDFSEE